VKDIFCDREGKAVCSCLEKVSVAMYSVIEKGKPSHCPLNLAHVQLWILLTKTLFVLVEILPPQVTQSLLSKANWYLSKSSQISLMVQCY